ncbi:hypothetical protein SEVIR_2G424500v4 [Setaria viridis]|uniref:DUF6598 domain-containing protein n=1 Tax=Setaria viridis TaxID=4556 RepID=A0A4V6DC28_SETVI|nr:hypothetical protein SEVIR_2G424500v2 [Setaria viridis]
MRKQLIGDDADLDEDWSVCDEARRVIHFRSDWEFLWSPDYGSFEDITRIPPMRFTFKKAPSDAMHENALQIFSAMVTATSGGLPIDVFGPTRAVLLESRPDFVFIEVDLTVKGTADSEDEKLSPLVVPISSGNTMYSHMWKCAYTSKLSTVEFTLGHIIRSVVATIFVRVTRGSWPDGFHGQFSAIASGEKVPVTSDGDIKLSRRVVSVDTTGELKVYVKARGGDNNVMETWKVFKPLDAGRSNSMLDIGFCKMDITVAWSLISYNHVYADTLL